MNGLEERYTALAPMLERLYVAGHTAAAQWEEAAAAAVARGDRRLMNEVEQKTADAIRAEDANAADTDTPASETAQAMALYDTEGNVAQHSLFDAPTAPAQRTYTE